MMLKGLVEAVDGAKAAAKVRFPQLDGLITDWLPVMQALGMGAQSYQLPRKGSQVFVLADDNLDDGVVVGCLYSIPDPPPVTDPALLCLRADDGTLFQYDPTASELRIEGPKSVKVTFTEMALTGKVKLVGDLEQTGNQTIIGNVKAQGLNCDQAVVGGKDFLTHRHSGVQTGSAQSGPVA